MNDTIEMILVPRAELLAWAKAWQDDYGCPNDGTTDCVTPFDTYLLKTPVEARALAIIEQSTLSQQPAAEAKAQGGEEVVAWAVVGNKSGETINVFHGTREKWLADTKYWAEHGFRTRPLVYGDTAPPSAPVEDVEAALQKWLDWCNEHGEEPEAKSGARIAIEALAQQPAAEYKRQPEAWITPGGDVSRSFHWCLERCLPGEQPRPLYAAPQQPVAGEEIMVNAAHDVYTLPLQPSGLSSGPRFVVHVPPEAFQNTPGGEANARLIAAAPELLEVLEECRFALEPYDDIKPRNWKTDRERLRRAHESARAAIAKATGLYKDDDINDHRD